MSSLTRVLAILDLFTEARSTWHADDIIAALDYARPTAYRYIKDLVEAGYLQKVAAGRYALGARIIELDYLLRNSDPLLLAAVPVMEDLARRSGLDAVLTAMFRDRVVDIYRVHTDPALKLSYGRGRPRPLFHGVSPKMILANLSRARAIRVFDTNADEIARLGLGTSWPQFRESLNRWRKQGTYLSMGELEPGRCSMAAPVINPIQEVAAALALVGSPERFDAPLLPAARSLLIEACQKIETVLAESVRNFERRSDPP